jgi:hypothetical protein
MGTTQTNAWGYLTVVLVHTSLLGDKAECLFYAFRGHWMSPFEERL